MTTQKLLIVHQGALGDVIVIFPIITRLASSCGAIDILCQSQLGRLAKELGLVRNWFALEEASVSSLFSGQPDRRIKARLRPYDRVVLFSFSSELEKALNQITRNRCVRLAPKPPVDQPIHITRYAKQNLMKAGLLNSEDFSADDVYPFEHPAVKQNRPKDPKKILLHPGSGSKRKRWPLSHFTRVASLLHARGLKIEYALGPAEADLLGALQKQDRIIHVLDNLLDLAALYKAAGGYIGNDSGASHLAAFMGLASVVIFGPADPRRWRPNGPLVEVARPALQCRPCFETDPANCSEPKCLADIQPHTVVEIFLKLYRK